MNLLLTIFGLLALVSALGVVICRKTVYSALSLVGNVASLAVVYLLLNAQFLFAVQLIIYAGAVVVLFIFIIALLNPEREDRPAADLRLVVGIAGVFAVTVGMVLVATNGITTTERGLRGAQVGANSGPPREPGAIDECAPSAPTRCHDPYHAFQFRPDDVNDPRAGNVQTTGGQLFTTFLLPFEITSLLLLVAAIGAVYLTRRPDQDDRAAPPDRQGRRGRGTRPPAVSRSGAAPSRLAVGGLRALPGAEEPHGGRRVAPAAETAPD
ncbi:MAG: NADH-quinone oxidoreductase subunit J [Candidatus Dormibacteria bacterium]